MDGGWVVLDLDAAGCTPNPMCHTITLSPTNEFLQQVAAIVCGMSPLGHAGGEVRTPVVSIRLHHGPASPFYHCRAGSGAGARGIPMATELQQGLSTYKGS